MKHREFNAMIQKKNGAKTITDNRFKSQEQRLVYQYVKKYPGANRDSVVKDLKIDKHTASYLLNGLVLKGLLVRLKNKTFKLA